MPLRGAGGFSGFFGDGSDGVGAISSTVSLTRDMFYTSLTITSPGILQPNGHAIWCQNVVTVGAGAIIQNNGGSAVGSAPGSEANYGSFDATDASNGRGASGYFASGNSTGNRYESLGGSGGNGGLGSGAGSPGSGGFAVGPGSSTGSYRILFCLMHGYLIGRDNSGFAGAFRLHGGVGGGSGRGSGFYYSGGGGGGGGIIPIFAREIVVAGTIKALGGAGSPGEGTQPANPGNGGGGGGGGGVIILVYHKLTQTGTLDVSGGAGGAAQGTGTAGTAGGTGTVIKLEL